MALRYVIQMTSSTRNASADEGAPIRLATDGAPIALAAGDAALSAAGVPGEAAKGRPIEAVCVGTDGGVCLAAADAAQRLAAGGRVSAALDQAARAGAPLVRLAAARREHPVAQREVRGAVAAYEDTYHLALDALAALRFEAGLRGVRLAVDAAAGRFLMSPIEARAFFDSVNSPWVGACLEVEACAAYADPADWIRTLGHRIAALAVRAGDAAGVDWPAVEQALRAARLDVPVLIDSGENAARAVDIFNDLNGRLGGGCAS